MGANMTPSDYYWSHLYNKESSIYFFLLPFNIFLVIFSLKIFLVFIQYSIQFLLQCANCRVISGNFIYNLCAAFKIISGLLMANFLQGEDTDEQLN